METLHLHQTIYLSSWRFQLGNTSGDSRLEKLGEGTGVPRKKLGANKMSLLHGDFPL